MTLAQCNQARRHAWAVSLLARPTGLAHSRSPSGAHQGEHPERAVSGPRGTPHRAIFKAWQQPSPAQHATGPNPAPWPHRIMQHSPHAELTAWCPTPRQSLNPHPTPPPINAELAPPSCRWASGFRALDPLTLNPRTTHSAAPPTNPQLHGGPGVAWHDGLGGDLEHSLGAGERALGGRHLRGACGGELKAFRVERLRALRSTWLGQPGSWPWPGRAPTAGRAGEAREPQGSPHGPQPALATAPLWRTRTCTHSNLMKAHGQSVMQKKHQTLQSFPGNGAIKMNKNKPRQATTRQTGE